MKPSKTQKWTADLLHDHLMIIGAERDRQYAQRFDGQEKAVVAAVAVQEKAVASAMAAAEKAVAAAMAAAEKAVSKAENATEKRFEGVNEFRAQLSDQSATFITRVEYEAVNVALSEKIDELKSRADLAGGRSSGIGAGWGYLVAAVTLLLALVAAFARMK